MRASSPHDVRAVLLSLARRLTAALARAERPRWTCKRVLPRIDGTAEIALDGPAGTATWDWLPPWASTGEAPTTGSWHWGRLRGPTDAGGDLEPVLSRTLARALERPVYAPLRFINRELDVLPFDDRAVDLLLGDRLAPGRTHWYEHVFGEPSQENSRRFTLPFHGPGGALELEVCAPDTPPPDGELLLTHPQLQLWLTADPRPRGARARVPAQVERFVGFLISRAVHPGLALAPAQETMDEPADHPGQEPQYYEYPVSASTWGAPGQWYQFFADFEIGRSELCNLRFVDPIVWIEHGEPECQTVEPRFRGRLHTFTNMPFRAPLVRERNETWGLFSNLTEREVVLGGDDKLRAALDTAVALEGPRQIMISNTCLPKIVGDDLRSLVRRAQQKTERPILTMNTDLDSTSSTFSNLVTQAARASDPQQSEPEPDERSVSLFGYVPGPQREELSALLEGHGISTRFLVPELSVALARAYRRGTVQVAHPRASWAELREELFADLETPLLEAPAPYGLRDSRRWLDAIVRGLDLPAADERTWDGEEGATIERFASLQEQTRGLRVAVVVDRHSAPRLVQAGRHYGVPLLPLLEEMGFGLDVLLYGGDDPVPHRPPAEDPEPGLREALAAPEALRIHPFTNPAELDALLERGAFGLVYSELAHDHRLLGVGKVGFGLDLFEMGPRGAVRSLERLLRRARWSFPARYARYSARRPELEPTDDE